MDYIYKRIDSDKYNDLVYISRSAFGIDPGVNYYQSKNTTAKFGEPHLGFIAYSPEGEPAAFYGVYVYPVIKNGVTFVAAQSGDTMTHKNHMGKGLFTTLAKMTYDLAKEKGVDFIFGFPNQNSFPGFVKKLNWICPENLIEFRDRIVTIPLAKIAKKISYLSALYKQYMHFVFRFYKPIRETFTSSAFEQDTGVVNRTADFIKYKNFSGSQMINVDGVQVWVKVDGFLFIGDIERKENIDFKRFWKKIKRLGFFLGADVIIFQASKGTFFDRTFSDFLTGKDACPFGYLNLSGKTDPASFKFTFGDLDTF